MEMLPRLGGNYNLEIEVISKPRHEYQAPAYTELGLPKAPALMLDDEILLEGRDIDEKELGKMLQDLLIPQ